MFASKIILFLFSSNCESPYKSISIMLLSIKDSKLGIIDFTPFIRSSRWLDGLKNVASAEGNV